MKNRGTVKQKIMAGIQIEGLETEERAKRTKNAHKKLQEAYQNSHIALLDLLNFLNMDFKENFIEPVMQEISISVVDKNIERIHKVLERYLEQLNHANVVQEISSDATEEFYRSMINFPPKGDDEKRKFSR
jgi:hypothetical protein